MASTHRSRQGLLFWLLLALTVYTLTSAAIAISTSDKCGGMQASKTWEFAPPGWDCQPVRLPGQG